MSTIVTRSGKGAALTHTEVDANFTNLNTDKAATADVILATQKGAVSGVCPLDATSKVAATYLPSYVDDVLEYANLAGFPVTGETGKIYVALDTNKTYRWSGSAYIYITSGAVDSVAGKTGVVTLTSTDVGLGNVTNTSDVNKPISTATQSALDLKASLASPTLSNPTYTGTLTGSTGILNIGSGQVYKDASGNVGIGTSSPLVVTNQTSVNVNGTSASRYELLVGGTRTSYVYTDASTMQIGSITTIPVQFMTTSTERMRIDSSGNVGIGTSAGTAKLHVATSSTTAYGLISQTPTVGLVAGDRVNMAYFTNSRGVANDGLRIINYRDSTGSGVGDWPTESYAIERNIDNVAAQSSVRFGTTYLRLDTVGVERLRIDGSGNVGIGTSSPAADTAVTIFNAGTALSGTGLLVRSGYPGYSGVVANILSLRDKDNTTDTFNIKTDGSLSLNHFSTSGTYTNSLTVNASGNVGIGTSSPATKLDVSGVAKASTLSLSGTTAFSAGTISQDVNWGMYFKAATAAAAEFAWVSSTGIERMRIDSAGNVGIGTSSPSTKLTVAGAVTITGAFALRGSYGGGAIASNFAAGDGALIANTTGSGNTASGAGALYSNTTGTYNSAMGMQALLYNTTGTYNSAMGMQALLYNTTGIQNSAMGVYALQNNTTGTYNSAVGMQALFDLKTTTIAATAIVAATAYQIVTMGTTTSAQWIASGAVTGTVGEIFTANATAGVGTGTVATSANVATQCLNNTALGYNTGRGITTGTGNTIIGASVTGLAAGLTNNIILANGTGSIRVQSNATTITFTDVIKPQQATTAAAPAYVKGGMYFDTTLNKMRIGGATAWETITSV